jgi:signal transduction histidine kinase
MLLGRLRIRGKLAVLVTIPLLAVVGFTVPVVIERVDQANRASDTADLVRVAGQVGALVQDLQQERLLSVAHVFRTVDDVQLKAQVATVTQHVTALKASLGSTGGVSAALDGIQTLAPQRDAVLKGTAAPDKLIAAYAAVITKILDSLRLEPSVDVRTLTGREVVALDAALRTDEGISTGAGFLLIFVATKNPQALVPYLTNLAVLQTTAARFTAYATAAQGTLYSKVRAELNAKLGNDLPVTSDADPTAALAKLTPQSALTGLQSMIGVGRVVEQQIVSDVTAQVTKQQNSALTTAYLVGGLTIFILLLVALLSVAVARAVARPLTRLTTSADRVARVAETELVRVADDESDAPAPVHLEPVDVTARDEIGDLARAFERVQGTAARLVERQVASRRNVAQMFGHVGRRTQNLVGRQIALIDRLERDESDPDRLQHLYRLDHVSSRLRRNAGSLVVLSGSTGSNEQTNPLSLIDVVRLALGEIEDYVRVDVEVPAGLTLVPNVINDVVLMLAELMENATVFSPPHTRVTVYAQAAPYGAQVAIVDHGIGLRAERLTDENVRLAHRERLDLAPTEVLGLFVVGRLARRHGLGVTLADTPGGGLTATITIGDRLLTTGGPTAIGTGASRTTSGDPWATHAIAALPAGAGPADAQSVYAAPADDPWSTQPVAPGGDLWAAQPPAVDEDPWSARPPAEDDRRPVRAGSALAIPAPFDLEPVRRADHLIETGGRWNAFVPRPRDIPVNAPSVQLPPGPTTRTPPPLRQRVPGAQAAPTEAGTKATAPTPVAADAVTARALVDDFEAGVRRAQLHASAPLEQVGPQLASASRPSAAARGGQPAPLTRRVPGATLDADDDLVPHGSVLTQQQPLDPSEARDLVEQFESGVLRALREVRSDHQYGEGTS